MRCGSPTATPRRELGSGRRSGTGRPWAAMSSRAGGMPHAGGSFTHHLPTWRQLPRRARQADPRTQVRGSKKTVLVISHDREVLAGSVASIITLEGSGAWVHG